MIRFPAATILALILSATTHAAERIPGTQVTLDPPAGFELTTDFVGYQMASTGASFVVYEIPGPFAEVSKGMTAEKMKEQGLEIISREETQIGDVNALLLNIRQEIDGVTYLKWMLVMGEKTSVMIYATAEESEFGKLSDNLKKTLLAVKWDPDAEVGILEGLPFTLEEAGDLKFAFKMAQGVILSRDGVHPLPDVAKPLVIFNSVADAQFTPELDAQTYAHALLGQLQNMPEDLKITEEKAIKIGDLDGHQVTAVGRPEGAKTDICYNLAVALTTGRLYMFHCRVASSEQKQYEPVFEKILSSVELK